LFIVTYATYQVTLLDSDYAESGAKVILFLFVTKLSTVIFWMFDWNLLFFSVFLAIIQLLTYEI